MIAEVAGDHPVVPSSLLPIRSPNLPADKVNGKRISRVNKETVKRNIYPYAFFFIKNKTKKELSNVIWTCLKSP